MDGSEIIWRSEVDMENSPFLLGLHTSKLVQDVFPSTVAPEN